MKTKILIAVMIAVVVSVAFSVRATRQIGHGGAAVASLTADRVELLQKAARLEARLRAAQTALVEITENTDAAGAESVGRNAGGIVSPAGKPSSAGNAGREVGVMTLIANDPRWRAEHLKNFRNSVIMNYGPHFRAVGMSPEQIERFKDIEVELEQTKMDLQTAVENHEIDPDGAAYKKLWADYNDARVTKKAEVLGDLTSKYLDYYRSDNVRQYARTLTQFELSTGEAITAGQIERAGDVLAANSQRKSTDSYPGWTSGRTIDWPVASEQLKTVLSPTQIEYIRLQIENAKSKARVDDRTKLLTAQFKAQSPVK